MRCRHLFIITAVLCSWSILALECNPPGYFQDYHPYKFSGLDIKEDASTFENKEWMFQVLLSMERTDSGPVSVRNLGFPASVAEAFATMPCDEPPYAIPLGKRTMICRRPLLNGEDTIPAGTELLASEKYFNSHYTAHRRSESPNGHMITDTVVFHVTPKGNITILSGENLFVFSVPAPDGSAFVDSFNILKP